MRNPYDGDETRCRTADGQKTSAIHDKLVKASFQHLDENEDEVLRLGGDMITGIVGHMLGYYNLHRGHSAKETKKVVTELLAAILQATSEVADEKISRGFNE